MCARSVNAKTPIFHFRPGCNRARCANKPIITRRVSLVRSKSGFLPGSLSAWQCSRICAYALFVVGKGPLERKNSSRPTRGTRWISISISPVSLFHFPSAAFFVFVFPPFSIVARNSQFGDSGRRAERAHQDFEDGNPKYKGRQKTSKLTGYC